MIYTGFGGPKVPECGIRWESPNLAEYTEKILESVRQSAKYCRRSIILRKARQIVSFLVYPMVNANATSLTRLDEKFESRHGNHCPVLLCTPYGF